MLRDVITTAQTSKEAADAAYEIAVSYGVPRPATRDLDRAVAALTDLARDYPDQEQAKVASNRCRLTILWRTASRSSTVMP